MPNICCADVYFRSENSKKLRDLNELFEAFTKKGEKIYFDKEFNEKIKLSYEGDTGTVSSYDFDGKNVLYVSFDFAWDDHREFLNALAEKLESKWSGLFDCDGLWKVDPLGFFKENYLINVYDNNNLGLPNDIYEFFENTKEVEEYLNNCSKQTHTFEEWKETFDESDFGRIEEIDEDFLQERKMRAAYAALFRKELV